MKALLLLAVLAFAAQAHLSTPAYHLGFTEQLGLTSQQLEHASTCFHSVKQVITDLHNVKLSKDQGLAAILRSLLTTVEDFDYKLKVDCSIYLNDLAMAILRNTNGDIKGTVLRNFDKYSLEIIQQAAFYVEALVSGNHYRAGHVEAYIIQILFGIEKPQVLPLAQFNSSNWVPMNLTKYAFEFTEGYFRTLGLNNSKAVQDNAECSIDYVNFVTSVHLLSQSLAHAQNVTEKVQIIEKFIVQGIKFYDVCVSAMVFNWEHIGHPIIKAFQNAPVHTVVALIHNIASNLPELRQGHIEMIMSIFEGNYYKAGTINAQELIALVKNFYF